MIDKKFRRDFHFFKRSAFGDFTVFLLLCLHLLPFVDISQGSTLEFGGWYVCPFLFVLHEYVRACARMCVPFFLFRNGEAATAAATATNNDFGIAWETD